MDFSELAVGIGKFQPDRARRLGPTASDFGKRVFETVDHIDAHPVLRAGDRIEDRLAAAFGHPGHHQARFSRGDIDLELYGSEDRIVQFFERGLVINWTSSPIAETLFYKVTPRASAGKNRAPCESRLYPNVSL